MKTIITMALCALLAACGGGDDPDQFVGPPDCTQGACR